MIKEKLRAAFVHAFFTILIALVTAFVVFIVWYPDDLARMVNGAEIYLIVLAVEVVLGPIMSLVIYNAKKPKSELVRDYALVIVIQLSALAYGLYSVALSRPVFLVFAKDRIEVVAAVELHAEDLQKALVDRFKTLPWFGPELVCAQFPSDPQEKSDLLLSALAGKDIQLIPSYYRECENGQIYNKAYEKADLFRTTWIRKDDLPLAFREVPFKWLPIVTRFGSWLILYPEGDISDPIYLDLDPFA